MDFVAITNDFVVNTTHLVNVEIHMSQLLFRFTQCLPLIISSDLDTAAKKLPSNFIIITTLCGRSILNKKFITAIIPCGLTQTTIEFQGKRCLLSDNIDNVSQMLDIPWEPDIPDEFMTQTIRLTVEEKSLLKLRCVSSCSSRKAYDKYLYLDKYSPGITFTDYENRPQKFRYIGMFDSKYTWELKWNLLWLKGCQYMYKLQYGWQTLYPAARANSFKDNQIVCTIDSYEGITLTYIKEK